MKNKNKMKIFGIFRNEIKEMTIKVSESFSATGAEFSIDLEKLKKLIDKNAIKVLAKVQEIFQIRRIPAGTAGLQTEEFSRKVIFV